MSGTDIIVDTNILIRLLKNDENVVVLLSEKIVHISFITELELYSFKNLTSSEKKIIDSIINDCLIIDINVEIKNLTIDFRKNYSLKLPDAIIAATASFLNVPFITSDSDFLNISQLNIVHYNK